VECCDQTNRAEQKLEFDSFGQHATHEEPPKHQLFVSGQSSQTQDVHLLQLTQKVSSDLNKPP
jgi:hypothetical protein